MKSLFRISLSTFIALLLAVIIPISTVYSMTRSEYNREQEVLFYDPNFNPCGPDAAAGGPGATPGAGTGGTGTGSGQAPPLNPDGSIGNIPPEGRLVAATYYGGNPTGGGGWRPNNGQQGGGGDDNGMGNDGQPLPGKVSFAELGYNNGGLRMGGLPPYTRLSITNVEKGITIIAEKRDVGGGGGRTMLGLPKDIDMWWEAARMLGMTDNTKVLIKPVPPDTPLTPWQDSPLAGTGPVDAGGVPGGGTGAGAGAGGAAGQNCEGAGAGAGAGGATGQVNAQGYAFPVAVKKNEAYNFSRWPCSPVCHHDRTGAIDITKTPGNDSGTGIPVIAIDDGTLMRVRNSYSGQAGCNTFQLKADDGFYYWYGHIQKPVGGEGTAVKAGQQVAVIGERRCTGNGSAPHLHIDRGWPKGVTGGNVGSRDPNFPQLIDQLYQELP